MIKIYYHIAKINNWSAITQYFFNSIFSSGLYDICNEIKIGISQNDQIKLNLSDLKFINYPKIKICKFGKLLDYEFPTLQMLHEDSMLENFNLLYFHTKGASFDLEHWNSNKEVLKKQYFKRNYKKFEDVKKAYKYTRYWTKNFLIKNYKECLNLLEENDIVCLKKAHNENFIPINFWWSKSSYIKNLDQPKLIKDRYDAEIWVCKNKNKKIKSFLNRFDDEYRKLKFL